MDLHSILKHVEKMNVKSNAFFKLYCAVSEKYWDIKDPDDRQSAARALVMFAERAPYDQVITAYKIIEQVFMMGKDGTTAAKLHIRFKDKEFRVDIYQDGIELGSLERQIEKAVKAMEDGTIRSAPRTKGNR